MGPVLVCAGGVALLISAVVKPDSRHSHSQRCGLTAGARRAQSISQPVHLHVSCNVVDLLAYSRRLSHCLTASKALARWFCFATQQLSYVLSWVVQLLLTHSEYPADQLAHVQHARDRRLTYNPSFRQVVHNAGGTVMHCSCTG